MNTNKTRVSKCIIKTIFRNNIYDAGHVIGQIQPVTEKSAASGLFELRRDTGIKAISNNCRL